VAGNETRRTPRAKATTESTTTFQEQAYDFVKAQIMNLDLKPGAYITDSQVAEELDISRTPVREALRRLEQEGLLVSQARRGWKIYTLSLEDIHEIFDIKETLEGLIARRAAECEDDELRKALRESIVRMNAAGKADDADAWHEADSQLHEVIFAMGGNARATSIIRSLNDQWHRVRIGFVAMHGRIERSNPEHEAIVESILAGKGEQAEQLMRVHLNNVRQELVRLLVNLVLPFVEEGV
jgi:DNA-binding GntR family transcriptional regulator